jgi:hypothetical protein
MTQKQALKEILAIIDALDAVEKPEYEELDAAITEIYQLVENILEEKHA